MTVKERDIAWTAADGTTLFGHVWEPDVTRFGAKTLVCLPGLTRNGRDFAVVARALAGSDHPRTVVAMDFRGRGRSGYADPSSYRPDVEASDTIAGLDALGLKEPIALLGTSRGGIVSMILATIAPDRVGPVILNDIGPVIEREGLAAIKARIGGMVGVARSDWNSAVADLKSNMGRRFTNVPDDGWLKVARQIYRDGPDGRPVLDYDPALVTAFSAFDETVGLPPFWPAFEALADRPVLVIRGERSDLLSEETVAEMQRRLPQTEVHRVPAEGHAPLLWDEPTITRIENFLARHAG